MGKAAGATPSATKTSSRKRPNAPGQQSIAAAFQAAKRSNTNTIGAGKLNNRTLDSATDVAMFLDQPQDPDVIITQQHGSAAVDQDLDKPRVRLAAADNMQQQEEGEEDGIMRAPAAASADPAVQKPQQQQKQLKQLKQQTQRQSKSTKPAADTAAAATRKPRAQSGKVAIKTPAAAAAAAAARLKDSDSEAESLGLDSGAAAAGDGDAVAAAAEASFSDEEIAKISGSLLAWYDKVQRILPWRRNPYYNPDTAAAAAAAGATSAAAAGAGSSSSKQKKPTAKQLAAAAAEAALAAAKPAAAELSPQEFAYYVWVSEIMLQQTQVSRVVTYFNKWIAAWPTVTALAAATQEEVNEVWAGLGYYRRAKYLLDGAKFIVNKLGGKFPETAAQLRQIPGVGPYTAAAVASIAFNDQAAAVDGNVIRVCARLRAVKGNPTKLMKVWDKLAAQILHPDRPGCHNQAMMELGATVCKPVNPSCDTCPVSSCCTAYKLAAAAAAGGDLEDAPKVTDYPEKVAKAAKAEQQVAVCVLKVLLLPDATTPAAVAAAAAAAPSGGSSKKAAAGGAAAGGVKPSGIRSFFKPTSKQQQDAGSAAAAAAAGDDVSTLTQQQQLQLCESDLLAAGATAYYLLVQRPENGILAGLWEFPGTVIDTDPTPTARRCAVDKYMSGTLNLTFPTSSSSSSSKRPKGAPAAAHSTAAAAAAAAAAGVHVVHRRQLGTVVHIFSHIRQTLHAEELVVLAPSLHAVCTAAAAAAAEEPHANTSKAAADEDDSVIEADDDAEQRTGEKRARSVRATTAAAAASGKPGVRWVAASDMVQAGLTSGVRKVFNLSLK